VAHLPRLPPAAEHRVLKAVCGLPPRAQRRLFGPPPQIDGQTLATDVHALLRMADLGGSNSFTLNLDAVGARKHARHEAEIVAPRPQIPMARVEPIQIPGPDRTIGARYYAPLGPPGQTAPPPLLVFFHGGGWVIGDLDTHDGTCRYLAAHSGVHVLAVDYRLAPEHPFPAALEDAWEAYGWAVANAARLGLDPARIAVGGDSAGGNLSAVVCLLAREEGAPPPTMQLLIYPATDPAGEMPSRRLFDKGFLLTRRDMEYFEDCYLPPHVDRTDPRISTLHSGDLSHLPPAYVATAGFDPLRDEGEAYALRMREAGVRVALRRHSGLVHSFANQMAISRSSRYAMLEMAGALRMGLAAPGVA
jgi:acetyl esterase